MDYLNFALNTFMDTHETVLMVNVVSGELIFLRHKENNLPLNTPIDSEVFKSEYFSRIEIHPDDLYKLEPYQDPRHLKKRCDEGQGGSLFSFRRKVDHEYLWVRMILSIPSGYSEENPYVILYRRDLPQWEADQEESLEHLQKRLHKVIKYNLTTGSFRVIRQRSSEDYMMRRSIRSNVLSEEWAIEERLIHPDDMQQFLHFTDPAFIRDYFLKNNEELAFFYRRKIGAIYQWVKFSVIPSTEYNSENQVYFYTIEDVDSLLTNLLDQHGFFQYSEVKASRSIAHEIYYDNLLHALTYFTQRYIFCYMIDLDRDMYIMYKIQKENISGTFPYVGDYSAMAGSYLQAVCSPEQKERLISFASAEALRAQMVDKASLEISYTRSDGQVVTNIYSKIESKNGIPSKLICCAVPARESGLLKVRTFGNFEVLDASGAPIHFARRQGKELLAYLIDRQGYPASTQDIVEDVLEKDPSDLNAVKYVSTLSRSAAKELEKAGYPGIIIKEWNSLRVNTELIDCDYYHLIRGDVSYLHRYHNEYMKEYSWAEETNAEILHYSSR